MTLGERLRADAARLRETASARGTAPLPNAQAWREVVQVFEATTGIRQVERTVREPEPAATIDLHGYQDALARLAAGEPMAYVLGGQWFLDRLFRVTPAVLIPRDDTATLVAAAVDGLAPDADARILDLGTGSGCIAISIALARPRADIVATDRSLAALAVARDNAARLGARNVRFAEADWFAGVPPGPYRMIVANPPYIDAGDPHLVALGHEPVSALVSGSDGLDDLRRIVAGAAAVLAPHGRLLVEHGHRQRAAVLRLFEAARFDRIETFDDPGGNPRVVAGRRGTGAGSAIG